MPAKVIKERDESPKIIECESCERPLKLDSMTVECDCGAFYNGFGQRLAPPSQWGWETGEKFGPHGEYLGGGDSD